jgi:hypothetical protein
MFCFFSLGIYSKRATATSRRSKIVQLLHIPSLIALILSISGGTDQASSTVSDHATGKTETRAGIILFLAIYVAACILWASTLRDATLMNSSQKRLFFAVLLALPLIAVRLLYSLISDFGNNPQFSLINGDTKIQLGMATIEEFIVVLMYTILGVLTPRSTAGKIAGQGDYATEDAEYGVQQNNGRPTYDQSAYAHSAAQEAYNQQYARR